MKYLDDMLDKYGFSDGEAVPDDALARRTVYIAAINAVAQRMGVEQRAEPYNRPGCHNWCLIAFTGKNGYPTPEMLEAITVARIGDWDSWVSVEAKPHLDFEENLDSLVEAIFDENPVCDTTRKAGCE